MFDIVIRSIKHHKCSDIYLFITYTTRFGRKLGPSSGDTKIISKIY